MTYKLAPLNSQILLFCRNSNFIQHCSDMVTVLGIPLIGTLFLPTVLSIITFYIIWSLSTRRKAASCTTGLISATEGPSEAPLTVNNVDSEPKKEVFGNRVGSSTSVESDNSCDINSLLQQKLHYSSNSKRKVFRSKVGEQISSSLKLENGLAKKNVKKKRCKGKAGCCSKKKSASSILEGTIETVKVFYGTHTGKSKVKYNIFVRNSQSVILVLICFQ